jgi:hypothetical protein
MAEQESAIACSVPETSLTAGSHSLIGGKKFPAERRAKLASQGSEPRSNLLRQTLSIAAISMKSPVLSQLAGNLGRRDSEAAPTPHRNESSYRLDKITSNFCQLDPSPLPPHEVLPHHFAPHNIGRAID